MKYLLSTGGSTNKVEYYIIDLFKLYLSIYPKDIPNAQQIGFDFILTDVKKDELLDKIKYRVNVLIDKIKNKFSNSLTITINSLELVDQSKVKLVIDVNQIKSDEIEINIEDKN